MDEKILDARKRIPNNGIKSLIFIFNTPCRILFFFGTLPKIGQIMVAGQLLVP